MKNKTVILVVAMVALLFGAKFGYDKLKNNGVVKISSEKQQEEVNSNSENQNIDNDNSETDKETQKTENEVQAEAVKAPNFKVRDIDGNHIEFESFKGKPVVINFWATWCVYCRKEMPDFQDVYDEYKDKGIEFMLINATDNQSETREMVLQYLKDNNITMPVYYDEGVIGVDGLTIEDSAQAVYGVPSYPSTVFIDKDGNISGAKIGMISKDELLKAIENIL